MHINRTPDPAPTKPRLNTAELAEVLTAAPAAIRHRAPLKVLAGFLYGLAFRKPALIEEVEHVLALETRRRTSPLRAVAPDYPVPAA